MKRIGLVIAALMVAASAALAADNRGHAPRLLAPPTIVGAAVEGRDLRVTAGRWVGARSIGYRWQWCPAYSRAVSIDSPIAWWRLGELRPRRLIDASSYGNGGSYPRGVRVEHGSPLDHPGTGYGDTAVRFLGTGAARVPATVNLQALGSGYLSLELWLRPDSTPRGVPVIAQTDGNGGPWRDGLPPLRFGILLTDARTIAFRLRLQKHPYDNDGTVFPLGPIRDVELRAPLRAGPDGWTHIVATHSPDDGATGGNGGRMRIYVNGVLAAAREESGAIPDSPPTPVWIGGLPAAHRFFKGALDEVALYLRPLNTQRVQLHYRVARHGCVVIPGESRRTHPLSNDDRGSHLRVRATATNAWGHATVFTKPTVTVAPEPPPSDLPDPSPTYLPGPPPP